MRLNPASSWRYLSHKLGAWLFDRVIVYNARRRDIGMNIYVGNLPYSVDDDELKNAFSSFGEVDKASVITDKYSGRSKGFGFVEMSDQSAAEEAIKALDGSEMQGRNIRVNQARPKTDRNDRR